MGVLYLFIKMCPLFPIRIIMLCLRLKLLQITNLHIRIKLGNSNPIKTIHIALVVTLKIPFHNGCIPRNKHPLYIPLQNSTFSVPILKPSYYLSDAFIHRTIMLSITLGAPDYSYISQIK